MGERDDWRDGPLPPDVKQYIKATRRASIEERENMLRFAPMLCRCSPWYDHDDPHPAQVDCVVHTTIMIDLKGGWL